MLHKRDRRRVARGVFTVSLIVAALTLTDSARAGVGDLDQPGTIEAFPAEPDGPRALMFPAQFDRAAIRSPSFQTRMVFPHVAVAARTFPYFPGEYAGFNSGFRGDLNSFANEVRQLLEKLWLTAEGHRALRTIQTADPGRFSLSQRWPIGSVRGMHAPRNPVASDVLVTIFSAPQGPSGHQRYQLSPLDAAGARSTGSGSAISFRTDSLRGAWQSNGQLDLVAPQLALGQLLIEASYPLLGADDGGELRTVTNTTVRDRSAGEYFLTDDVSVRELLAHGGEAERAAAGAELERNGKNPPTAWTGNDPLMREGLLRELQRPRPDPERVALLWEFARKPASAARLATQLDFPHPSIVDTYTMERRSRAVPSGWTLDEPLLVRSSSLQSIAPQSLRNANREKLATFFAPAEEPPTQRVPADAHRALVGEYQQIVDRDRRVLIELRNESGSEEGIDSDSPGHEWQDYIERQMFLENAYGNVGPVAEAYKNRLVPLARAAEKEKVDRIEKGLADC